MASATAISRTRETIEGDQLRLMDARGVDLTVFSPRASAMGHHFNDTRRYVDALALPPVDREKVYVLNARRVFPRLTV